MPFISVRILVALIVVLTSVAVPASAQTPSPSASAAPLASLELVRQPIWYEPGQLLGLKLRVTNLAPTELESFQLVVGVADRITTRSDLHGSFDSEPGLSTSSLPFIFERPIPPGESIIVALNEPITSFPTMSSSTAGGVFPATFTLTDAVATPLAALSTPFIFYPESPETRLNLALVVPLNMPPERGADSLFRITDEGGLTEALGPEGWLKGYLDTLESVTQVDRPPAPPRRRNGRARAKRPDPIPALHLSLAPTPRLLEEIEDLADGFETSDGITAEDEAAALSAGAALNQIRNLFGRSAVQPILVPYSFPDLPTLTGAMPLEHVLEQIDTARDVVERTVDLRLNGSWLFPPAGRLDSESLAQLQRFPTVAENLFLSDGSLLPAADPALAGCPQIEYTFACAAELSTIQGTSSALVADRGLTDRLARLPLRNNDRLWLQQFFAETSMIREETPGVAGRVIQATIPSLWHPQPKLSRLMLEGLRQAPWLNTVTGEEAMQEADFSERQIVDQAPETSGAPDEAFFTGAAAASEIVDSYGKIVPADNLRIVRLRRNILAAMSRSLWRQIDVAEDLITGAREEAEREMDKITLAGTQAFTFTARKGELQFVVINDTEYPVKLSLDLFSPNLALTETNLIETYPPGNQPITVEATARTSGQFPIRVRLTTPDGYPIAETTITIRSTSFNKIALILTVGALAFLILFYALRGLRRRSDEGAGA